MRFMWKLIILLPFVIITSISFCSLSLSLVQNPPKMTIINHIHRVSIVLQISEGTMVVETIFVRNIFV